MNNKSMGAFLAELRKEKGITQRELAEFLNVSDKTISHWECDENSPDLSVLPILAEYFGVTCDELIKGERKQINSSDFPSVSSTIAYNSESYVKCGGEVKINKAYSKHKIMCFASIFISIFFIAAAMLIIKLVNAIDYSRDFENIAFVFSLIFFPCLSVFITFISKQIFVNTLKSCTEEIAEIRKWKRKANLVCVFPLVFSTSIIFILVMILMPPPHVKLQEPETMTIPTSVEPDVFTTVPYDADTSVPFSADAATSESQYAYGSEKLF